MLTCKEERSNHRNNTKSAQKSTRVLLALCTSPAGFVYTRTSTRVLLGLCTLGHAHESCWVCVHSDKHTSPAGFVYTRTSTRVLLALCTLRQAHESCWVCVQLLLGLCTLGQARDFCWVCVHSDKHTTPAGFVYTQTSTQVLLTSTRVLLGLCTL